MNASDHNGQHVLHGVLAESVLGPKLRGAQSHVPKGSPQALARKHMMNVLAQPPEAPESALKGATIPSAEIQTEKPEHRFVIYLNVLGQTPKEIAETTGYTVEHVRTILAQPWARMQATRMMNESDVATLVPIMLESSAIQSIKVLQEIRDNPKEPANARITACKDLLDRYLGKPTQTHELKAPKKQSEDDDELDKELQQLEARQRDLIGRPRVREVMTPHLEVLEGGQPPAA